MTMIAWTDLEDCVSDRGERPISCKLGHFKDVNAPHIDVVQYLENIAKELNNSNYNTDGVSKDQDE